MPDPEPDDDDLSGLELATRYAVELEPPAIRGIDQLPPVVAEAVWELPLSGLAVKLPQTRETPHQAPTAGSSPRRRAR